MAEWTIREHGLLLIRSAIYLHAQDMTNAKNRQSYRLCSSKLQIDFVHHHLLASLAKSQDVQSAIGAR